MFKSKIKKVIITIVFVIINISISFTITNLLGVPNTIILKSYSVIYHDITWEVILFMSLLIIESFIYEHYHKQS